MAKQDTPKPQPPKQTEPLKESNMPGHRNPPPPPLPKDKGGKSEK